jgi:hypothetical protein
MGEYDQSVDRERMPLSYLAKRVAQFVDVFGQQMQPALRQIDGEEKAASGNEVATVTGHARMSK